MFIIYNFETKQMKDAILKFCMFLLNKVLSCIFVQQSLNYSRDINFMPVVNLP